MLLSTWVSAVYLKNKQLSQQFAKNTPFPHLVLHNIFVEEKIRGVARALLKEEWCEKESDLFQFQQTHELKHTRNKILKEFYAFFSSQECIAWIAQVTQTKLRRSVDMSGFMYGATDYLLPHDDRLEGRKIAYVLNLSSDFKKSDGGELEFFEAKDAYPVHSAKLIPPTFNTLTLFKVSPQSFHQVREVLSDKNRLSIGGWFHG